MDSLNFINIFVSFGSKIYMVMKKYRLLTLVLFSIAISFASCEKDIALTPNENFAPSSDQSIDSTALNGGGIGGPVSNLIVQKRQRAVVTYVGATWCPPCGAYGDPTKIHMETAHGSDVIILNVQSGDAISSQGAFGPTFGRAFQTFANSSSIPYAYWSGANFTMVYRGFYTSANSNNSAADQDINSIKGDSPEIGVAAKAVVSGDSIKVETLTKFYSATTDAYIGVYILEDGVEASQKISGSPDAITSHENVVRGAAFVGNDLGIQSLGNAFAVDQQVIGNYSIAIPSTVLDKTKLQVAVVVWESENADGISNGILVDAD